MPIITARAQKRKKKMLQLLEQPIFKTTFFFSTRVCIFFLAHTLLWIGPAKGNPALPLFDTLSVTSACLLTITCSWLGWELLKILYTRLVAGTQYHVPPEETASLNRPPAEIAIVNLTPWVLWYYVHVISLVIYVFAYSAVALSPFPSLALTLTTAVGLASTSSSVLQVGWVSTMLVATCLYLSDALILVPKLTFNLIFTGLVMPAWAAALMWYIQPQLKHARITPHDLIAFTLPSLAMFSVLVLFIMDNDTKAIEYYYYYYSNNFTTATATSAVQNATTLASDTNATTTTSLLHHLLFITSNNSTTWLTDTAHGAALSFMATLACPYAVFVLLHVFLSAFNTPQQAQSNASAFVLAVLLRRFLFFTEPYSWLVTFAFLFAVVGALLALLLSLSDKTISESPDIVVMTPDHLDELEEENAKPTSSTDTEAT
jgi:hypothetical protein